MKAETFCKLYTQYHGEEIDSAKQLVQCNKSGEELHEFVSFCAKQQMKDFAEWIANNYFDHTTLTSSNYDLHEGEWLPADYSHNNAKDYILTTEQLIEIFLNK